MVDSINPSNPSASTQTTLSVGKVQKFEDQKTESKTSIDEVTLSDEAKTLGDIQKTVKAVSSQISSDKEVTLSSDSGRLNTLL